MRKPIRDASIHVLINIERASGIGARHLRKNLSFDRSNLAIAI